MMVKEGIFLVGTTAGGFASYDYHIILLTDTSNRDCSGPILMTGMKRKAAEPSTRKEYSWKAPMQYATSIAQKKFFFLLNSGPGLGSNSRPLRC